MPKYYGEFRDRVLKGEIPVNEKVEMEMNRIDDLIADPNMYYDPEAVERYIAYCETELTLADGSDMKLLETFKLWAEQVFGWYYFTEITVPVPRRNGRGTRYITKKVRRRLINKQYIILGRGGAKSMYASTIHSYFLNCDTSTTLQVATAPTMAQSDEVLQPIRTSITRARGPMLKFLTEGSLQNTTGSRANRCKLASTKKGVENFLTGSILFSRPMTIDKLQGLKTRICNIDEWLSGDTKEDVMSALEQSAAKFDDWLIIATSSEGTVRNGCGDSIKIELMDILKGEYYNPYVSIWWYCLDDISEVEDPSMWLKAQPNLGQTVSWETYQKEKERAEKVPSARNDILAKRFGIPLEGFTYFFTYDETLPHRKHEFRNMPCSLGCDMSQGDDFCAFTFLFPLRGDKFGVKTRCYITERTLQRLPVATAIKYETFMKEGSLIVLEGTVIKMSIVYDDLEKHINSNGYDIRTVGYDPYNAETFINRWMTENTPYGVEKVPQGSRTESVPLGELKKYAEDRKLIFDQEIMTFCMGHAITVTDNNGNSKLIKKKRAEKIDSVSAMLDAYVAFKANADYYE